MREAAIDRPLIRLVAANSTRGIVTKFAKLADYCREQKLRTFDLPFHKIEQIIGEKLPDSAKRPQYWANTTSGSGPVRSAMIDTPYETFLVAGSNRVEFRRRF